MSTLSGKVAIVTGGSRGIGLAAARLLRREGASVAVVGTNSAHLRTAVDTLTADEGAGRVEAVAADVRDSGQMEAAMARTASALGGIDIVINNAGVGVFKPVAEMSVDEWRLMFDTNITGVFNTLPRGAAAPARPWRRLGHQHQQPLRHQSLRRRRRVLRDEGRGQRVQRGVHAGSAARRHPRRLRVAGIGRHRRSAAARATSPAGRCSPRTWRRSIVDLVAYPGRSLPSRVEMRPSQPPRKG